MTTKAWRSCEKLPDGTVSWMKSDLSVCRPQKLADVERIPTVGKNSTLVQVDQVADQVANLVDDALTDLKV